MREMSNGDRLFLKANTAPLIVKFHRLDHVKFHRFHPVRTRAHTCAHVRTRAHTCAHVRTREISWILSIGPSVPEVKDGPIDRECVR